MHEGSCHCGAVRLTLPATPEVATDCNCSLCRRGGVRVGGPDAAYGALPKLRLRNALGTAGPETGAKHGVNLGNFAPDLIASVRVRHLDGADTWEFTD